MAVKLSGWQRIGVIFSVLWFVGFGVFMFEHESSRHWDFSIWQLGNYGVDSLPPFINDCFISPKSSYIMVQPPGVCPPASVVDSAATLAMSSKTSCISSPVSAEHSA